MACIVLFSNWTKLFQNVKNNFCKRHCQFSTNSTVNLTKKWWRLRKNKTSLFFKYKTKCKPYQCRLYVSIANVTLFLIWVWRKVWTKLVSFWLGFLYKHTYYFFFKQLLFSHSTQNFLVRYWSRFSKVFGKFFRDQSLTFLTKKTKVFGKFFRAIAYISTQKNQSFWKVFGKFLESFPKNINSHNFRKPQPQV